jgi:hypothetical protein
MKGSFEMAWEPRVAMKSGDLKSALRLSALHARVDWQFSGAAGESPHAQEEAGAACAAPA